MDLTAGGYVKSILLRPERVPSYDAFPFSIPVVRQMPELDTG